MKKLTMRQKQAISTKRRITKVAMDLIKTHGLDNLKITDICEGADISVGTYYHYFESKDVVIQNAYENVDMSVEENVKAREYNTLSEKILIIFEEANKNITDLGYKFMGDIFKFILSSPLGYSIENSRYPYNAIERAVAEGIKKGEFKKNVNPLKASHDFMKIGRGTVFDWCLYEGEYDLISETEELVKAYLDYIKED